MNPLFLFFILITSFHQFILSSDASSSNNAAATRHEQEINARIAATTVLAGLPLHASQTLTAASESNASVTATVGSPRPSSTSTATTITSSSAIQTPATSTSSNALQDTNNSYSLGAAAKSAPLPTTDDSECKVVYLTFQGCLAAPSKSAGHAGHPLRSNGQIGSVHSSLNSTLNSTDTNLHEPTASSGLTVPNNSLASFSNEPFSSAAAASTDSK